MNTNKDITIGEYFKDVLERKNLNIDLLLEYIDKYDITDLYNKEEFLILYYKIISEKNNRFLVKKIRKDYNIKSDISSHFLGRLLMRFKDYNSSDLFKEIDKLITKGYYKHIANNDNRSMTLINNTITIVYKSSTNVIISIFKNNNETGVNIDV